MTSTLIVLKKFKAATCIGIFRLSLTIAWQVKLIFFFPDKASGYWGKTRQKTKEKEQTESYQSLWVTSFDSGQQTAIRQHCSNFLLMPSN